MKDSVIVVFNESTFHNFREYQLQEFINQNIINEIIIGEPEIKYKAEILETIKSKM